MPYSTRANLVIAAGGEKVLLQLADLNGDGAEDDGVIDAAITAADSWIDAYVQKRHAVPLSAPIPATVVMLSAQEAVYQLRVNRRSKVETDETGHAERLQFLQDVADGKASLGVDPLPTKSTNVVPEVMERRETEDVSRLSTKGFW